MAVGAGVGIGFSSYGPGGLVGGGPSGDALLLEDSGYLLLEDGDYLLLE